MDLALLLSVLGERQSKGSLWASQTVAPRLPVANIERMTKLLK